MPRLVSALAALALVSALAAPAAARRYAPPAKVKIATRAYSTEPAPTDPIVRVVGTRHKQVRLHVVGASWMCNAVYQATLRWYFDAHRADEITIAAERSVDAPDTGGTCALTLDIAPVPAGTYDVHLSGVVTRVRVR